MATEPSDEIVELRFNVPRWVADVLDAHCSAKRLPRTKMCESVMCAWAAPTMHLANVVGRVTRGNGFEKPSGWSDLDV